MRDNSNVKSGVVYSFTLKRQWTLLVITQTNYQHEHHLVMAVDTIGN